MKKRRTKDDERFHKCFETQRIKFRHPPSRLKSWSALQIRINKGLGLNVHSSLAPMSTRVANDSNFLVGTVDGLELKQQRTKDDERLHKCYKTQRVKFRHPPSRLKSWSALQIRINKGLGLNVHSSLAPMSTRVANNSNVLVGVVDG